MSRNVAAAKPPLPYGWSCHVSKSVPDRCYYFNRFTGANTWDLSELIPPVDQPISSNKGQEGGKGGRKTHNCGVGDIRSRRRDEKECTTRTREIAVVASNGDDDDGNNNDDCWDIVNNIGYTEVPATAVEMKVKPEKGGVADIKSSTSRTGGTVAGCAFGDEGKVDSKGSREELEQDISRSRRRRWVKKSPRSVNGICAGTSHVSKSRKMIFMDRSGHFYNKVTREEEKNLTEKRKAVQHRLEHVNKRRRREERLAGDEKILEVKQEFQTTATMSTSVCNRCEKTGHFARECPEKRGEKRDRKYGAGGGPKCYKCYRVGHFARDCKDGEDRCYRCFGSGHIAKNCTQLTCMNCNKIGHIIKDCPNAGTKTCYKCGGIGHILKECPSRV